MHSTHSENPKRISFIHVEINIKLVSECH